MTTCACGNDMPTVWWEPKAHTVCTDCFGATPLDLNLYRDIKRTGFNFLGDGRRSRATGVMEDGSPGYIREAA